jgi:predicted membrane GTPase involved in stress response
MIFSLTKKCKQKKQSMRRALELVVKGELVETTPDAIRRAKYSQG